MRVPAEDDVERDNDVLVNNPYIPNVLSAFDNITCCGDSLTVSSVFLGKDENGWIVRNAHRSYPQILGSLTGADVETIGKGGWDAINWWKDYGDQLREKDNQLVIVYLGTNLGLSDTIEEDAPGDNLSQYADTETWAYCKIVKRALDLGARVLLIRVYATSMEDATYVEVNE